MNDNHTRDDILSNPQGHFPWLSTNEAGEAHAIIKRAIQAHLDVSDHDLSALPNWILEDLAVAGLEIVRRP